jgi:hypothetical protein
VDLDVATQELASVMDPGLEPGDVLGQLREVGPAGIGGGARRPGGRERFEFHADLGDVGEIGDVDRGREGAAPGVGDDETIALQPLQRFAYGSASGAELLGERVVVQRLPRPDVEHDQAVPDPLVRPVGERRRHTGRGGQLRRHTHRSSSLHP